MSDLTILFKGNPSNLAIATFREGAETTTLKEKLKNLCDYLVHTVSERNEHFDMQKKALELNFYTSAYILSKTGAGWDTDELKDPFGLIEEAEGFSTGIITEYQENISPYFITIDMESETLDLSHAFTMVEKGKRFSKDVSSFKVSYPMTEVSIYSVNDLMESMTETENVVITDSKGDRYTTVNRSKPRTIEDCTFTELKNDRIPEFSTFNVTKVEHNETMYVFEEKSTKKKFGFLAKTTTSYWGDENETVKYVGEVDLTPLSFAYTIHNNGWDTQLFPYHS